MLAIPEILLLHDGNAMVGGAAETLSLAAPVRRANIRSNSHVDTTGTAGVVVCVQHSKIKDFGWFKSTVRIDPSAAVFIVPSFSTQYTKDLEKLEITDYLVAPAQPSDLVAAISAARNRMIEDGWQKLRPASRDALVASRKTFTAAFDDVRKTGHVDVAQVSDACDMIAKASSDESLTDWLTAIKDHHDYTYRHCMFVCGSIVHFGEAIGIRGDDLKLLSLGGMLHDIGKARIPLAILDKPTKLDPSEQLTMRDHPSHSRDIMASLEGLDPRIVAMAVQHHEKLDGTGYPDGLVGSQIDDLVRMTAIADVFSALIDARSYKPAMSYEDAFAKMETMEGHLDLDILTRFKDFAMATRPEAA